MVKPHPVLGWVGHNAWSGDLVSTGQIRVSARKTRGLGHAQGVHTLCTMRAPLMHENPG